ncbi:MAG: porphobilinogen synthase [Phycisphaeraceae bacterium]
MLNDEKRIICRPRRLRRGQVMRDAVADVRLHVDNLVMPLFVREGHGLRREVASMPGVAQMSPDVAVETMRSLGDLGVNKFILFGVTDAEKKDAEGTASLDPGNPVNATVRLARQQRVEALLIADLCFCEYTDHGHCGTLCDDANLTVDNDATLPRLGQQAVVLAESGCDIVAPSGMMDGQVAAIRSALDEAKHTDTAILSYAVKYASAMYGPFRDAGEGAPSFGDRRGYQMDYRRSREWQTELALDEREGADMVMIKPAAHYLDIIAQVRRASVLPVAAYHVSGEFSMIHAAAEKGYVDLREAALEVTTAIRRAGADLVLTYFAPQLARWLR